MAPAEPSSITIAIPGQPNTSEEQFSGIKFYLMEMTEAFKGDINNSLLKKKLKAGQWYCMSLMPAFKRQRQGDF